MDVFEFILQKEFHECGFDGPLERYVGFSKISQQWITCKYCKCMIYKNEVEFLRI